VTNGYQLQALGGCLCFVHQTKDKFLDIWFLRKKGETSSYDVNEQEFGLLIWITEFSIPFAGDNANPIALTRSGEVLLSHKSDLWCYDPKTASFEKLMDSCYSCRVVPHTNSFVSLKALGEKCRSRKRYKANTSPREFFIKKWRNA
ncbi:hypothetical protein MKW94_003515, partial [Papaver nudicaule]|nr:hypothetical protein [Papaver nudicaule]